MSQPWDCLENLKKWIQVIERYIEEVSLTNPEYKEIKKQCNKKY